MPADENSRKIFDREIAPLIDGKTSDELIDVFSRTSKDFFDELLTKNNVKERQFAAMVGFKDEFFVRRLAECLISENRLTDNFYCKKVTSSRTAGIKGRITSFISRKELTFGGDCVIFNKTTKAPVLIIECKEYIDMTRLKELIGESRILKARIRHSRRVYPNLKFWVFAEVLELTADWQELLEKSNLKYKIDKIFIARNGKRTDTDATPDKTKLLYFKQELEALIMRSTK